MKYHGERVAITPFAFIHHDRKRQGNMRVYNKNHTLMQLLFVFVDVNSGPFKNMGNKIKLIASHLKAIVLSVFSFQFDRAGQILKGYLDFFARVPKIRKDLRINRTVGPHWISI